MPNIDIGVLTHARLSGLNAADAATGKFARDIAALGQTAVISGGKAALLEKTTTTLARAARLAAAESKAEAAAFRAAAAEQQQLAAAQRTAVATARAQAAAMDAQTAAFRSNATASRATAAGYAAQTAQSRAVSASYGVQAAQSRAAAAAAAAYIAQSRAATTAMSAQAAAGQRLGIALNVTRAAAAGGVAALGGMVGVLRGMGGALGGIPPILGKIPPILAGIGGAIPPIINGFTALGAAGFGGAKRAGDALIRFVVGGANAAFAAVTRLTRAFRGLGAGLYGGIRGLGTALGVLTAAFGVYAISQAVKFQEQLATINTIAQLTAEQTHELGRDLRDIAIDRGLRLDDLTASYYEFLSAGITLGKSFDDLNDKSKVLAIQNKVITATADLAIGGLATQTEATKLMSFALNAYNLNSAAITKKTAADAGLSADTVGTASRQISDYFAKSVEIGVVKASEIASTFATVAASAKIAGIGLDEVAAAYASQTRRGVSAARVAVSMNRAIQDLLQPSKTLRGLQDKLHVSFLQIAGDKGIGVAFQTMKADADRLGISFRDLFKRQEGWRFALNITGEDAKDYNTILRQVRDSTKEVEVINGKVVRGTAAIQAAIRGDTVSRNVIKLQEAFRSLGITIGYWFLAPVNEIIKAITSVISTTDRWLDNLDENGLRMARMAASIIGATGVILALGAGLQGFLLISSHIAPMFGVTATGARALQVGIRALAFPLAIIVGYIGALAFAIDNNIAGMGKFAFALGGMRDLAAGLATILRNFFGVISETLKVLAKGGDAGAAFTKGLAGIGEQIAKIGPLFNAVLAFLVQSFLLLAGKVIAALSVVLPKVAEWALSVADTILRGLLSAVPGIIQWAADVAATVGPALEQFARDVVAWFARLGANIAPYLAAALVLFVQWASSVVESVIPRLGTFVSQIANWLGDVLRTIAPLLVVLTAAFVQWAIGLAQRVIPSLVEFGRQVVANIRGLAEKVAPVLLALTAAFVQWAVGLAQDVAPNLLLFVRDVVANFQGLAQRIAPVLLGLTVAFVQWAVGLAQRVIPVLIQFGREVVANIQGLGNKIAPVVVGLAILLVDWIRQAIPKAVAALGQLGERVLDFLRQLAPKVALAIGAVAAAFVMWVGSIWPTLLRNLTTLFNNIVTWVSDQAPRVAEALVKWGQEFADWFMNDGWPAIQRGLSELATNIFGWLSSSQTIRGVTNAILTWIVGIYAGLAGLIGLALDYLALHLPDLLNGLAQILGQVAQGMLDFVGKYGPLIAAAALALAFTFVKNLAEGIAKDPRAIVGSLFQILGSTLVITAIVGIGFSIGSALISGIKLGMAAVKWVVGFFATLGTQMAGLGFQTGVVTGGAISNGMSVGARSAAALKGFGASLLMSIAPGMAAAGGTAASIFGSALLFGLPALAFAAVALVGSIIQDGLNKQQKQISASVAKTIATGSLTELETSRGALEAGLAQLREVQAHPGMQAVPGSGIAGALVDNALGFAGGGTQGAIAALQADLDATTARIKALKDPSNGLPSLPPEIEELWANYQKEAQKGINAAQTAAKDSAFDLGSFLPTGADLGSLFPTGPDIAQQARDAAQALTDGYTTLKNSIISNNAGLESTTADLETIVTKSSAERIKTMQTDVDTLRKRARKATRDKDFDTALLLNDRADLLEQRIKETKYNQDHYYDLIKDSAKPADVTTAIDTAKAVVDEKNRGFAKTALALDENLGIIKTNVKEIKAQADPGFFKMLENAPHIPAADGFFKMLENAPHIKTGTEIDDMFNSPDGYAGVPAKIEKAIGTGTVLAAAGVNAPWLLGATTTIANGIPVAYTGMVDRIETEIGSGTTVPAAAVNAPWLLGTAPGTVVDGVPVAYTGMVDRLGLAVGWGTTIPAASIDAPWMLGTAAGTVVGGIPVAYTGMVDRIETAVGAGTSVGGPTVIAPWLLGTATTGVNANGVPTAYADLGTKVQTAVSQSTVSLPAPSTSAALTAVSDYVLLASGLLDGLAVTAGAAATNMVTNIVNAMAGNRAKTAAQQMLDSIKSVFVGSSLFESGAGLMQSWVDGMNSKRGELLGAAIGLAGIIASTTVGESPPREGPLSTIDQGGANLVTAWIGGMLSQVNAVTGAANQVAYAALPPDRTAFMMTPGGGQVPGAAGTSDQSEETQRLLRMMLAALGLNNELTAQGVTNRPRAVDQVGAKGVIAQASNMAAGRV